MTQKELLLFKEVPAETVHFSNIVSKKYLEIQCCEYMTSNKIDRAYFKFQHYQNGVVTLLCITNLNTYLIGLTTEDGWKELEMDTSHYLNISWDGNTFNVVEMSS